MYGIAVTFFFFFLFLFFFVLDNIRVMMPILLD